MSLDNSSVVDAVGIEKADGSVVLSIIDSWGWEDESYHLEALQEKLNAYFGFVESGQIYESYPDAVGKALRIDVIGRYPIPTVGIAFLEKASAVASKLQIAITNRLA
jgi:hypothetical protein